MAFRLESGKESNMFDGPMSFVKERDACGVGFIFNGNKGGKKKYGLCVAAPLAIVNECHVNIQT
jgi:hypothetical protein